jgi:hypothetical protein
MWVVGTALGYIAVVISQAESFWYYIPPFGAIVWAMIGIIGADIDERKKNKLGKNRALLGKTISDYVRSEKYILDSCLRRNDSLKIDHK